jgi:hypothetical protein
MEAEGTCSPERKKETFKFLFETVEIIIIERQNILPNLNFTLTVH